MPAVRGVGEKDGQNGCFRIDGKAKGTIIEFLKGLPGLVKSAFREYDDAALFVLYPPHKAHATGTVVGAVALYHYHQLLIDKPQQGPFRHFKLAQCPEVERDSREDNQGIHVRNMVGHYHIFIACGHLSPYANRHTNDP